MERKYYEINEAAARRSKEMMSFDDYREGSATSAYRQEAEQIYQLAEKVADRRPDAAEKAEKLADQYAKLLADYYNTNFRIDQMCPSVMIAGPAKFPIRKKEKQNQAWDRNQEKYKMCKAIEDKIRNLLNGKEVITAGDPEAIEKLKNKLANLEQAQETMKAVNSFYRKYKTLDGCPNLPLEELEKLKISLAINWRADPKPFESWALSNNNAEIRRVKERIKNLEEVKARPADTKEYDGFSVVEDPEAMRIKLLFEDKPSAEIRDILKKNGFRWSPRANAWQTQLTNNGRYRLERVLKELEAC